MVATDFKSLLPRSSNGGVGLRSERHERACAIATRRLSATLLRGLHGLPAFALAAVALVGLPLEQRSAGPNDTLAVLFAVAGAAAVGAVASVVCSTIERDPTRAARVRLAAWTVIRFFLAYELTRFGVAKVVGMQFYPRYYQLDSRVADLTSMHLAWIFFGHAYGYQAISGAMEVAGAVLLCFRRTTTLGACVLFAVLSNVVLVNFYYDVPVKLFSSTYLVMTLGFARGRMASLLGVLHDGGSRRGSRIPRATDERFSAPSIRSASATRAAASTRPR